VLLLRLDLLGLHLGQLLLKLGLHREHLRQQGPITKELTQQAAFVSRTARWTVLGSRGGSSKAHGQAAAALNTAQEPSTSDRTWRIGTHAAGADRSVRRRYRGRGRARCTINSTNTCTGERHAKRNAKIAARKTRRSAEEADCGPDEDPSMAHGLNSAAAEPEPARVAGAADPAAASTKNDNNQLSQ
jgi:hypothetical protein